MPRTEHTASFTTDKGKLLQYKGARPTGQALLDMYGVHLRSLDRMMEQEEGDDLTPEALAKLPRIEQLKIQRQRLVDADIELKRQLDTIWEINGTAAGEHDREDIAACYNNLMDFFSGAANSDSPPNTPEHSEDKASKSTRKGRAESS